MTFHNSRTADIEPSYRPLKGHAWAYLDDDTHQQVWQLDDTHFCVYFTSKGTFASAAGLSPRGGQRIPSGITGRFEGASVYRTKGNYSGTPLTGSLGTLYNNCQISNGSWKCKPTQSWKWPVTFDDSGTTGTSSGEDWRFRSRTGDVFWWDGAHGALGDILR